MTQHFSHVSLVGNLLVRSLLCQGTRTALDLTALGFLDVCLAFLTEQSCLELAFPLCWGETSETQLLTVNGPEFSKEEHGSDFVL